MANHQIIKPDKIHIFLMLIIRTHTQIFVIKIDIFYIFFLNIHSIKNCSNPFLSLILKFTIIRNAFT